MNEPVMWGILTVALSWLFGRIVKVWPKLPKGALPWVVLAAGYLITFGLNWLQQGMAPADAALAAWTGLGWGMAAVGGHEALKPLLAKVVGDDVAAKILGRLPPPKEPKK